MNAARRIGAAAGAVVAMVAAGCGASGPRLSPEQRDAIETREVRAPRDDVLRAAASVMLDEGYLVSMSDHAAGLIGGFRLSSSDVSERYQRTGGMWRRSGILDGATVWVRRGETPGWSIVRVQLLAAGRKVETEETVTRVVQLVERRAIADARAHP